MTILEQKAMEAVLDMAKSLRDINKNIAQVNKELANLVEELIAKKQK